jgi:mannose-6-phosphate isomerase-like protein (cupin superfamily)
LDHLQNKRSKRLTSVTNMHGYVQNIEKAALENTDFRRVVYTSTNSQIVLMSIKAGEEIGAETHDLDQFFRVEAGEGKVILDGIEHEVSDGFAILIPEGTLHNVINTGDEDLKLYSIYTPPQHEDGTVHHTKAEADAAEEHFDGETTE